MGGRGDGGGREGGGGWRLYLYICLNPLEIFIVVCVHGGIYPVSISVFFCFRKSFRMNHLVFSPEVKLES